MLPRPNKEVEEEELEGNSLWKNVTIPNISTYAAAEI